MASQKVEETLCGDSLRDSRPAYRLPAGRQGQAGALPLSERQRRGLRLDFDMVLERSFVSVAPEAEGCGGAKGGIYELRLLDVRELPFFWHPLYSVVENDRHKIWE